MRSNSSLSNNLSERLAISETQSTSNDREHAAASTGYVVCKLKVNNTKYFSKFVKRCKGSLSLIIIDIVYYQLVNT